MSWAAALIVHAQASGADVWVRTDAEVGHVAPQPTGARGGYASVSPTV